MKKLTTTALITVAILGSFVISGGSQTTAAQDLSSAILSTRSPAIVPRPVILNLKCHIERFDDETWRVVIVNTLKRVVKKGSLYSYTIMGNGGAYFSTFEGRVASDLQPLARWFDDFQQEILSCRAVVHLTN